MDADKLSLKNKRHIWLAAMFSLIMPGMGQIYCGRFVRGLIFTFLHMFPLSLLLVFLAFPNCPILIETLFSVFIAGGIVQMIAIIDAALLAKRAKYYELKEYNRPIVYILFLLLVIGGGIGSSFHFRENLMEALRVPSATMYPTIVPNDRILANKLVYKNIDPKRGDIIVFLNPDDRKINYIKRVVAIAGDTVEIKDNELYINDQKLRRQKLEPSTWKNIKIDIHGVPVEGDAFEEINGDAKYKIFITSTIFDETHAPTNFPKTIVLKNRCFVLGDNRNGSLDSRYFGLVPLSTIKGRADYLYCPAKDWSRFGSLDK